MVNGGSGASSPAVKSATPRTPASRRATTKTTKGKKNSEMDTASDDSEESMATPSNDRKRRRKSAVHTSYAESDATSGDEKEFVPVSKKVKPEPAEDEGFSTTAAPNSHLENEDEDEDEV